MRFSLGQLFMSGLSSVLRTPNRRIAAIAAAVLALDQLSKWIVLRFLDHTEERIVLDGFFKFVHWENSGAAWSMFRGSNQILAIIAIVALVVLYFSRHHFDSRTALGQLAFGLIVGGILGNLTDRLRFGHVIDFIYFYLRQRGGGEIGFPAFNIADSAICTGVGLVFLLTWKTEQGSHPATPASATSAPESPAPK